MTSIADFLIRRTIQFQTSAGWPARWLFASVITVAALELRLLIADQTAGIPYVTFFPAATVTAVLCGFWPAMAATVAGATLASYYFIEPLETFAATSAGSLSAMVFCFDELAVCTAIEAMRRYYQRSETATRCLSEALGAAEVARREAEQANCAKSRFLASVSHDLRQPFQALRLFNDTLRSRCRACGNGKVIQAMDAALSTGESLLHELADYSVLYAGLIVPRPITISTTLLMQSVLCTLQPLTKAKGLRLRINIEPKLIDVDPALFCRLLGNLTTNAAKFTDRGDILVGCRSVPEGTLVLVKDTGIGIPDEQQDRVFEEFFQLHNDERDRAKGVGLGLPMARRLAEVMGLRLRLVSRPGKGTLVALILPDIPMPPAAPVSPGPGLGLRQHRDIHSRGVEMAGAE